jgi:hypothetical protein
MRPDKLYNISEIIKNEDPDFVLLVGDMTDNGGDGTIDCMTFGNNDAVNDICCTCFCGSSRCVSYYTEDQLGFLKKYVSDLEGKIDPERILTCVGNHDMYTTTCNKAIKSFLFCKPLLQPVYEYVKERENGTIVKGPFNLRGNSYHNIVYSRMINCSQRQVSLNSNVQSRQINDVNLICLGLYPNKETCDNFLTDELKFVSKKIIFFHFNLEGPFSDWWSDSEKEYFYNTIQPYLGEIICIVVGHCHVTYDHLWKNIRVLSGAGSLPLICDYDGEKLSIKI